MLDLKIVNGIIISDGTRAEADLAIDDGIITDISAGGHLESARETIDASGCYVLPGIVDVHFHCRAPSHPERGDFASETKAAAAGGVTTVCEMPVSEPACSSPSVLESRRALAEREAYTDVALYAGGGVSTAAEAQAMADAGAVAFKLFTHRPPAGRAREFEGLWATDEDAIHRCLAAIASTGLVCTVHAENQRLLDAFDSASAADPIPSRPPVIEAAAIALVAILAADVGARVHIAHLTSRSALGAFQGARASGCNISAETCPQYMKFDEAAVSRLGAFAKVAPPLRSESDCAALWAALEAGDIEIVASDHAPFLPAEKRVTYRLAPQGVPGADMLLPIMLDAALSDRVSLERVVNALTANPARRFGLYGRKGTLSRGADADVVVVRPGQRRVITTRSLLSRAGATGLLYEGMKLNGEIVTTLLRGHVVFAGGRQQGPAYGRFIRP
jgi:allantoinase